MKRYSGGTIRNSSRSLLSLSDDLSTSPTTSAHQTLSLVPRFDNKNSSILHLIILGPTYCIFSLLVFLHIFHSQQQQQQQRSNLQTLYASRFLLLHLFSAHFIGRISPFNRSHITALHPQYPRTHHIVLTSWTWAPLTQPNIVLSCISNSHFIRGHATLVSLYLLISPPNFSFLSPNDYHPRRSLFAVIVVLPFHYYRRNQ